MPIPPGTKFHGVAPGVETENKGSASRNANRDVYTIEEFGGGGGGIFETDILYNLTDGFTFGRLTGSGTYAVGENGISVVDFIRDVLIMQSSTFRATPIPQFLYNLQEGLGVELSGEYDGGASATLSRRVNGGAIEVLQEGIEPGEFNFQDLTLPSFAPFTDNYIQYYLNVLDDEGQQVLQEVSLVNQQPYVAPSVITSVLDDGGGRSPDASGLVREFGNDGSNIGGVASKISSLVPMTEIEIFRGSEQIESASITDDPDSETIFTSDNPASPTTDITYTTRISDTKSDNDGDLFANVSVEQTVSMRPPMMFIASSLDGSGATPGQALYDSYEDEDSGYFRLFAGQFAETFSTVGNMGDITNYAWVLVDDSLGSIELRQGGSTGPIVNFDDFGTETIVNDFGVSVTMRLLRSPFTGPFSEGTNFYIKTNG